MYVSKKKMGILLIGTIFIVIEYFAFDIINIGSIGLHEITTIFAIIVLTTALFQVFILKMIGIDFSSPIVFFLLFCYVFHFGQILVTNVYDFDYVNYVNVYMSRNMDNLRKTIMVCLYGINATFFGCLLAAIQSNNIDLKKNDTDSEDIERKKCLFVGKWLFILSSPFRFFFDIRQMIVAMALGYHGVFSLPSISGVFSALAGFWYSSVLFIYIGNKNKRLFWFGIIYAATTMLTGNRGHQLTNILIMVLVYIHLEGIKFKPKQIIKYGFLSYWGLIFIDMIMNFRSLGISSFFANFSFYLSDSLKTNILFESIGSFGETIFTPYIVINQVDSQVFPIFGEAWLCGLLTVFPNIGGITSYTNAHSNYPKMLITDHTIGGSYIGDLFYNFREAYWIIAILIGISICSISIKYKTAIRRKKYSLLLYYIPVFYNCCWLVRDSVGNLIRPLVWQILLSIFLLHCFSKKNPLEERYEKKY